MNWYVGLPWWMVYDLLKRIIVRSISTKYVPTEYRQINASLLLQSKIDNPQIKRP